MKIFLALLALCFASFSQTRALAFGAENESSGNIMSVSRDEHSLLGNPSGLAFTDTAPCVSLSSLQLIPLREFSRHHLSISMAMKKARMGLSLHRYGTVLYHEHRACVGFAHRIRSISLGVAAGMYQCYAEGQVNKTVLLIDLGGTVMLSPSLGV
ncbi:MAG TPA: hypothetical protein VL947_11570, partial [Cytophagales bacterium]|nr:hypothetical protein [Cytophagales bacterium]